VILAIVGLAIVFRKELTAGYTRPPTWDELSSLVWTVSILGLLILASLTIFALKVKRWLDWISYVYWSLGILLVGGASIAYLLHDSLHHYITVIAVDSFHLVVATVAGSCFLLFAILLQRRADELQ